MVELFLWTFHLPYKSAANLSLVDESCVAEGFVAGGLVDEG